MLNQIKLILGWLMATLCMCNIAYASTPISSDVRLYTLDCGMIHVTDGEDFSDTGYYRHKPLVLSDPCYLIKHDNKWMLWDLGLGDKYINNPYENKTFGVTFSVSVSLIEQLKQLGLTPNNIDYVGISHAHLDHVGNINLFPKATLLMQKAEYISTQQHPTPLAVTKDLYPSIRKMQKTLITGNYDVFGDGSVILLSTPGHTPGEQSLELKLPHSGVIILSGDVYHTFDAYKHELVPVHNVSRSDSLASMKRLNGIIENTGGRLVIQHNLDDFEAMPKFPKYLY